MSETTRVVVEVEKLIRGRDVAIAVGDIHGHLCALNALMPVLESLKHPVCFLGDYFDRGESSAGVVEMLVSKRVRKNWQFLRGNHEDQLDRAFEDGECRICDDPETCAYQQYFARGGLPDSHRIFLNRLTSFAQFKHTVAVHGGIPTMFRDTPIGKIPISVLVNSRSVAKHLDGVVVHGHTPVRQPTELVGVEIALDTSFFGYLSAGIISDEPEDEQRLLGYVSADVGTGALELRRDMEVLR